ncbi:MULTISPECIES: LLM class flavin-dependent oxidoreductase [Microbacterium]|uniref:LLM class flavin-dependent oxidoreductase n=1 Tax=Microbacterium TaxID=33882 RepID=UPI00277D7D97|nr:MULTISPECIES: LLM class flavin-dependent oxidoreductase [Microbacterium]MDQ1084498.1 alkanesulfonate monooxygenase SsuD/methylene tetrahydromethanopterin reductase-like flavin-dependent oxidoreductase (luciferase family) [Microbacterium sp. SORGH_AS_0344]MDQ1170225.1 alkanesulfonate monooxygenase SsuD/methylene tetrahydromethanopterin reductase-like flavin-dependent oxidoreductase (luciferase family) [Microbacterium proteolyticum]
MRRGAVSLGLAGSLGPEAIARIAPAVESAGFHTLWVNDTPDGDALAALAAASRVTERLHLATGVVPVDRRPAEAIADEVTALGVPLDRLMLGIGSGAAKEGELRRVREAIDVLHAAGLPRVLVGALGPKMRRTGAENAEGVLLNWVPPTEALAQAAALHAITPDTHVAVYVRTAIVSAARSRLDAETARYASFPNYAANFERMGVDAADTTIRDVTKLADALEAYTAAADEVVLRAIVPEDTVELYIDFARRTAPSPG